MRVKTHGRNIQFIPIRLLLKALNSNKHIRDLLTQQLEDREFMRLVVYQGFLSLFAIYAFHIPLNSEFDLDIIKKSAKEQLDVDLTTYVDANSCKSEEGVKHALTTLFYIGLIMHIVQVILMYSCLSMSSIKFIEEKDFKKRFCRLLILLGIIHGGILTYACIVMQFELHTCEGKFLSYLWADIILGVLSMPQIYMNYYTTRQRDRIN